MVSQSSIYVDRRPVITTYYLQNGYLMVPGLFFKNTGVFVDWDFHSQSVVLTSDNRTLSFPSGQNFAEYYNKDTNQKQRDYLPTIITSLPDGTYVPLQYTAETLGMRVSYDFQQIRTYIDTNTVPSSLPAIYYRGATDKKEVALTFDDGPDHLYTPRILDILREKGVKATFFVVGTQVSYIPFVLKRIAQEGHEIGNHSWSHPDLSRLTTSEVIQQIQTTEQEAHRTAGYRTTLFRPPFGLFTKADLLTVHDLGYEMIMWSVDTLDWQGQTADQILSTVKREVSPGAIILQHALITKPGLLEGSVRALPQIIDYLHSIGYEFVTVGSLI
ncbi:polysaccharide deacetylase family protein [Aneurinibacillus sp. Ricciae_BoGa-3]|uniref:polysaccharide deacetylase family protein n=1 Tax=Aneurinibacillus sp. Ricciae_BoGa-3 TaxID=3022697 RepID=UPI00233FD277|nr:polysaccharide deacetylase family protein [Aneurinibacillus sp. Ricciae_BoGa-3]WCK55798.1 polysaccharide deacetylase family protein [Aneurinibacillus sp. Ricciae_BoGa-3]